ncbi:hypothetical protein BCAH1134_C0735 (plasmid) [Bacillus cereus AH1134]|nr:hypothetical protein BCAH1134_C0735 [Bacillus cereus AH1134]
MISQSSLHDTFPYKIKKYHENYQSTRLLEKTGYLYNHLVKYSYNLRE